MGQTNAPEDEMEKEMQEYLDAKNKEVWLPWLSIFFCRSFVILFRSVNADVNILDQIRENQGNGTEEHEAAKDEVAMMNNQVGVG